MSKSKLIKDIEGVICRGLERFPLPLKKGNTVRIGHALVRPTRNDTYNVIDTEKRTIVATTNFRSSALAIAKQWSKGRNITVLVKKIDDQLLKHDNDIAFYKYTLNFGVEKEAKEAARVRYEISLARIENLMNDLKRHIYY